MTTTLATDGTERRVSVTLQTIDFPAISTRAFNCLPLAAASGSVPGRCPARSRAVHPLPASLAGDGTQLSLVRLAFSERIVRLHAGGACEGDAVLAAMPH